MLVCVYGGGWGGERCSVAGQKQGAKPRGRRRRHLGVARQCDSVVPPCGGRWQDPSGTAWCDEGVPKQGRSSEDTQPPAGGRQNQTVATQWRVLQLRTQRTLCKHLSYVWCLHHHVTLEAGRDFSNHWKSFIIILWVWGLGIRLSFIGNNKFLWFCTCREEASLMLQLRAQMGRNAEKGITATVIKRKDPGKSPEIRGSLSRVLKDE